MAEVIWTREALRWLREIHQRIAEDHPTAADKVVQSILDRTRNLAAFPEMGGLLHLPEHPNLRVVLYGHYRIVYRYEPPETVQIIGVYHGALHIEQYLPDESEPDTVHE